jgi:cyclohexyl-isocyanide hydratase
MLVEPERHLTIGALAFEGMDQVDLTGPFAVLGRLPNASYRIYSEDGRAVRDANGLTLTPDGSISDAPQLDVVHIPGGPGQQLLMENDRVLGWLRSQAAAATALFSVCTGALLCGAAGLLVGRRATTHWASFHLLPLFGATPVETRVLVDGDRVFTSGVTAGIDGALRLVARLRGDEVAQRIQLHIEYAPEPPFSSGTPAMAPAEILRAAREDLAELTAAREGTARQVAARLGLAAHI